MNVPALISIKSYEFLFAALNVGRQPSLGIQTSRTSQGGHTKHRREWNTRTVPGLHWMVKLFALGTILKGKNLLIEEQILPLR